MWTKRRSLPALSVCVDAFVSIKRSGYSVLRAAFLCAIFLGVYHSISSCCIHSDSLWVSVGVWFEEECDLAEPHNALQTSSG